MEELTERMTIYNRIGFKGLLDLVWKSTPLHLRWSIPYGLLVYRHILQSTSTIEGFEYIHGNKYAASKVFRRLRPRYTTASEILRKKPYDIK